MSAECKILQYYTWRLTEQINEYENDVNSLRSPLQSNWANHFRQHSPSPSLKWRHFFKEKRAILLSFRFQRVEEFMPWGSWCKDTDWINTAWWVYLLSPINTHLTTGIDNVHLECIKELLEEDKCIYSHFPKYSDCFTGYRRSVAALNLNNRLSN